MKVEAMVSCFWHSTATEEIIGYFFWYFSSRLDLEYRDQIYNRDAVRTVSNNS
jgi:hypothetical protein